MVRINSICLEDPTSGSRHKDALLTLSSKEQLVIPARLSQLLGLQPCESLELRLDTDGLRLVPQDRNKFIPPAT